MRDPDAPQWPQIVAWSAPRGYVISRQELLALGVGRKQIESWMRAGRLHRIHDGVYAVGRRDLTREGRWHAALRWSDPDGVLVERSAAAYWAMRQSAEHRITVAVRDRRHLRPPEDIRLRRPRRLLDHEVVEDGGLRITSPARTLLDLAGVIGRDDLRSAVKRADHQRVFDLRAVRAALDEHPRARGRGRLRAVLQSMDAWDPATREALEAAFAALIDAHRLPRPVMNTIVEGQLVDAVWHDRRVVVELDGYAFHGTRAAFQRDRRRTNDLQLAGYVVLRFTHADVTRRPAATVRRIRAALDRG